MTIKIEANNGIVYLNGKILHPQKSQKVWNHSPDGFAWGYGGSGPAQLALAILLELTDQETAIRNYQDFKWKVISQIPQGRSFEEITVNVDEFMNQS